MKRIRLSLLVLVFMVILANGCDGGGSGCDGDSSDVWNKTYGGRDTDRARAIIPGNDSGYLFVGSSDGRAWIVKIDENGAPIWNIASDVVENQREDAYALTRGNDGGYVAVGERYSINPYSGTNFGAWIFKIDENGNKLWQSAFEGYGGISARGVCQGNTGGYVVVARGDLRNDGGSSLIIKTDEDGNEVWIQSFGRSGYYAATSVTQGNTGGYLIAGKTNANAGNYDIWIMKIDEAGNEVWQAIIGDMDYDEAYAIISGKGGGYLIAGSTDSSGDVEADAMIIRIDEDGNLIWRKTYGDERAERLYAISPADDGGYVAAGRTETAVGTRIFNALLLKVDEEGSEIWQRTYGGDEADQLYAVIQANDSGYIVAGEARSYGLSGMDAWIIKTDENGSAPAAP